MTLETASSGYFFMRTNLLLTIAACILVAGQSVAADTGVLRAVRIDPSDSSLLSWVPSGSAARFAERRRASLLVLKSFAFPASSVPGEELRDTISMAERQWEQYKAAHPALSEDQAFQSFAQQRGAAASLIAKCNEHRMMVVGNLIDARIPLGLQIEGWEVGLKGDRTRGLRFEAVRLEREIFTGLEVIDGRSLSFQGQSHSDNCRGIIIGVDKPSHVETQTIIDWCHAAQGRSGRRALFDSSTGRWIGDEPSGEVNLK